jgi:aminoglycoside 3-N-acetyltransferase
MMLLPLKRTARKLRRRVQRFADRIRRPIDAAQIDAALDAAMNSRPDVLMVHSSLSACGFVPGGADTVIAVLATRTPTLVMPTHTYCYPPAGGGDPPVYDATKTPSSVGKITDVFWRQAGVLRSIHPTHSLAVSGARAAEIVAGHQHCHTPCGPGTPYERLIEMDAAALFFGATMFSYTFFHTTEHAANCPYAYDPEPCELLYVDANGKVAKMRSRRQSQVARRFRQMDRPLEEAGLLKRGRLGRGELLYIRSTAAVHQFLLDRMAKDPYYLAADGGGVGE